MDGRQKVAVSNGGKTGWGEGACSAQGTGTGECAASERFGWAAINRGSGAGLRAD